MKPKLSLDLSVVLRRHFVMTEEQENEVISEMLEEIKKRDEYVIGKEIKDEPSSITGNIETRVKAEQSKRQEETL